jgi:serine/threonine protein phosphatase 1
VYAVGDVHGRADLLDAIHAAVVADLDARPVSDAQLVHLGDYIDRGPDSAGVIARLADGVPQLHGHAVRVVNLMGNHEAMLLLALGGTDPTAANLWLANGGIASLDSWKVARDAAPAVWAAAIPPPHLALLRGLALTHRAGDFLFVHAGVRPGIALDAQTAEDLLWIREPFLSWPHPFDAMVVHGHTPSYDPVLRNNRIGLDTAAAMGGVLTCAVLEDDTISFIQRG